MLGNAGLKDLLAKSSDARRQASRGRPSADPVRDERAAGVYPRRSGSKCESFNGRTRDGLLNETLFFDLAYARAALARGVADTNPHRPRAALRD